MVSYKIPFKLSGTQTPSVSGYYYETGEDDVYKLCNGSLYVWKNSIETRPDYGEWWFIGEYSEANKNNAALNITVSSSSLIQFDGEYNRSGLDDKWYKSGDSTYYITKTNDSWSLFGGGLVLANTVNTTSVPFGRYQQTYPYQIIISGAGTAACNGTYTFSAIVGTQKLPKWIKDGGTSADYIGYGSGSDFWIRSSAIPKYRVAIDGMAPSKTATVFSIGGALPVPSISYPDLEDYTADVNAQGQIYVSDSLDGAWIGADNNSPDITYNENTIGESWNLAESIAYESLSDFLGNTDGVDCFRGYLPINDEGTLKQANVWMINSGGTSGDFDIERTYGISGNWCSELIPAEIVGVFENRTTAMNFSGAIQAWLKATNNLNQTGNVNWCHLSALPEPPEELIIGRHRYWRIRIPLEILFLTEAVYGD
jgi:hypothetical protein